QKRTSPSSRNSKHSEEEDMSMRSRRWEKHSVKPGPRVRWMLSVLVLLTATIAVSQQAPAGSAAPEPTQSSATQAPTTQEPTTQAPGPEASSQAPQAAAQGAAPLRVMVGKSLLINTTERLTRVSVTDDAIADAIVVTPTQILMHGRA